MQAAIITLHQSLSPGLYRLTLQFSTARKYRSAFSNAWGASKHSMTQAVMAKDTVKTFFASCPTTSGLWYERTTMGMHSRMGYVRRPDIAISPEIMLKMVESYFYVGARSEQQKIARATLFFLASYLGSFRGEKELRIVTCIRTLSAFIIWSVYGQRKCG